MELLGNYVLPPICCVTLVKSLLLFGATYFLTSLNCRFLLILLDVKSHVTCWGIKTTCVEAWGGGLGEQPPVTGGDNWWQKGASKANRRGLLVEGGRMSFLGSGGRLGIREWRENSLTQRSTQSEVLIWFDEMSLGLRIKSGVRARGLIPWQEGIVWQELKSGAADEGRQGLGEEAGTAVGCPRAKLVNKRIAKSAFHYWTHSKEMVFSQGIRHRDRCTYEYYFSRTLPGSTSYLRGTDLHIG